MTTTVKNPSFFAIQLRINILLKSIPILLILIYITLSIFIRTLIVILASGKNFLVLDPTFA